MDNVQWSSQAIHIRKTPVATLLLPTFISFSKSTDKNQTQRQYHSHSHEVKRAPQAVPNNKSSDNVKNIGDIIL